MKNKAEFKAVVVWRVRMIQMAFTCMLIAVCGKTLFLQSMKASSLKQIVDGQRRKATPTTIFRGEITDRNGVVLAVDTARYDLYLRPSAFKPSISQRSALATTLEISEDKLDEISKSGKIIKLLSSINRAKADSIAQLKITGLDLIPVNNREYPHGSLAAHLLGFVSWDSSGKGGIEESLNQALRSAHSCADQVLTRGDGLPVTRLASLKPIINSSFGQQVALTIDSKLQYKVEQILEESISRFGAQKGTVIVMSPSSGEILAWANSPTYDPNFYNRYPVDRTVNWAISQVYEPGSTFKILTVASALQLKAIKPDFRYLDEGQKKIGNRVVRNHDYKPGKAKEIGLVELFRFSSNTAAAEIGLRIEPDKFYEQLKKFGIASKTKIEIPGESAGSLTSYKRWKEIDRATTSFGQGAVSVTPIQLAAAVNVIANKGIWVQPHLIKDIKTADGLKVLHKPETLTRRVVSSRVAKTVSELLAQSIRTNLEEDESYIAGEVPGHEVAGKTGTAQKYCPQLKTYCPGQTIASFIGFFPANKPEYLVLVVVDSPSGGGGWGNTVAGPIFNQVGEEIIKLYPPQPEKPHHFALFSKP